MVGSACCRRIRFRAVYGGCEFQRVAVDFKRAFQRALFPLLQVAYHTEPRAPCIGLEHKFVVGGLCRFHKKYLDERTCFLAEVHACLYHLCVVEHHKRTFGQVGGQVAEHVLTHFAVLV